MENIDKIRSKFPGLQNIIQLSSCSQSALHVDVKESIKEYTNVWEKEGMNWDKWMEACEKSRIKFAQLINADPDEIAIVSSVSHAISSILTSIEVKNDKNEVILSKSDFPCIGHSALSQKSLKVKYVHPTIENYLKEVSDNTLLISAPLVSFYNGERLDIKPVVQVANDKKSYVFVDAYQAAGQLEIDVKKMDVDFLASGMQKYMLGMPGVAFLYIKREIANQLTPKITGWFGQADPFAFDIEEVNYAEGARRFDSGTFSMIHGYASNTAIDILLNIGIKNIEKYLYELSDFTIKYSQELGLKVVSPTNPSRKGSNTAIKFENASQIEKLMREKNIIVSARNDVIRIAPHFYNTKEEIKIAIDELSRLVR